VAVLKERKRKKKIGAWREKERGTAIARVFVSLRDLMLWLHPLEANAKRMRGRINKGLKKEGGVR